MEKTGENNANRITTGLCILRVCIFSVCLIHSSFILLLMLICLLEFGQGMCWMCIQGLFDW